MPFPSIFQRYDIEFTDRLYDDQDWIKSAFNKDIHKTVLDLACGTGRSSIQLLNIGANITGLDANTEALEIFKSKASQIGKSENLVVGSLDLNLTFPIGKWDMILFVGNSIGIFESEERLDFFFKWAAENLNTNGVLLISMTLPENGPIPVGVEQPRRWYTFNSENKYERSFLFDLTETTCSLYLKYWKENTLIHEDKLKLNRYNWKFVKQMSERYFGVQNVNYDLRFLAQNHQESREPYEVFFKINKI